MAGRKRAQAVSGGPSSFGPERRGVGILAGVAAAGLALGASAQATDEPAGAASANGPIEEVVVLGKFVPADKRITSEVANILDAEALSLATDTDVGGALSRVTGLSLVGDKYVYVRGLGERYSSTLLDGARMSSPVPFQKTVPLDIVPTSIVRNLLVQKTYSPDLPGDFSGGAVLIRTAPTPAENYLAVKTTVGGNSEATFGEGISYRGGLGDNWGFDDGTRLVPTNIAALSSEEFEATPWPQSASLGASFYNFWDVREKQRLKPHFAGDAEGGLRYDFANGVSIGFLAAGKYGNDWNNRDKDYRRYEFTGVDGGSTQTVDYRQFTTRQTINWSGFANFGVEFADGHSLQLTYLDLVQTDDETQRFRGLSSEDDITDGTPVTSYRLQWTENAIRSTQLGGEHYFGLGATGLSVNWRAAQGRATRDAPDTRTYSYAVNAAGLEEAVTPSRQAAGDLRDVFQAPDRVYSELRDDIAEYGIDAEFEFALGGREFAFKFGGSAYERERASRDRFFRFDITSRAPSHIALMTPSQLFGLGNWGRGYLDVRDFSAAAANASGIFPAADSGEETTSYYAGVDVQLNARIRAAAGVRREQTTLFADAYGGNTLAGTSNAASREYSDTLPAASLTFEFVNDMQLRLAYSRTLNRPGLLEITGTTIRNPEDSNLYRGNVFLTPANVDNLDLRWEWYFGADDSLSVGLFAKTFDNPIEIGKVQAQNDIYTWFNGEEAKLRGVEAELRKALPLGSWLGWRDAWDHFGLQANVSRIDSSVTLFGAGETAADVPVTGARQIARLYENERPLSGQSDVLGNLILSYADIGRGIEGSLAYNYTGERIVLVGAENAPNIVEASRGRLDLLARYLFDLFGREMEAEFKAMNLLDDDVEWRQGGLLYERYNRGIGYSLAVKVAI